LERIRLGAATGPDVLVRFDRLVDGAVTFSSSTEAVPA
jgi:hypothetical protein